MTRQVLLDLTAWAVAALTTVGVRPTDAQVIVDNLAYAERRGTSSHGFVRLAVYIERLRAGGLNAAFVPAIEVDLGGLVTVDGDAGPGQAVGRFGAMVAADRAEQHGIGCAIVRNTNHFGAAGQYAEMIADRGLIGIVACNTNTVVSAPGGGRKVIGTNPLSIALPVGTARRPVLDMATSEVAQGKVIIADKNGTPIPLGWAVDPSGAPTTSAAQGLAGALLPAAGPKGYGLAVMIDALLAAGGTRTSPHVVSLYGHDSEPQALGHFFLAMKVPVAGFDATVNDLLDQLAMSRPPGEAPVLFPGEPEATRAAAFDGTIDLPDETIAELRDLGTALGLPLVS